MHLVACKWAGRGVGRALILEHGELHMPFHPSEATAHVQVNTLKEKTV
jgi:hypothetical protein